MGTNYLTYVLEGRTLRYLLGIDGGGTKTALCAADISVVEKADFSSAKVRYAVTSGTSWREHGAAKVAQKLCEAVRDLSVDGQIAGVAMGLPCYGESHEGDSALEKEIARVFCDIPVYITNDVEVGWAGSLALEAGINIVAGTGSIAYGKDGSGKTARSGGWSEFFGDEGSCYWVGRKVLELFSKQADGRIPKDPLYETVRRAFGVNDDFDIIDPIYEKYMPSREQVASLQLLAEEAALLRSSSALEIYEQAVDELYLLAAAVYHQLDFDKKPFKVSYSGGLFKGGELVLPQFSRKLANLGGELVAPRLKPEEGAVLLAHSRFMKGL